MANQCDSCGTNWPHGPAYVKCPACDERCRTAVTSHVLTPAQARDQTRHIQFERYCSDRDLARDLNGDPSPEDIGRQEAHDLAEAWRGLVDQLDQSLTDPCKEP